MKLNEISLSTDLKQIELEINHHKNIAGQSIWEIGRRLNHVKENDLAHGEFGSWVESINMSRTEAFRFMKVATELPNVSTLEHLGTSALYLIATLPEPERTKEHVTEKGEVKTPDEMTVKELQELKKQLRQKDELIESLGDSMHDFEVYAKELESENERLKNQKPQEPTVIEKEVIPEDYEGLKESNAKLLRELQKAEYEATTVREAYDSLIKKRHQEDEGSRKYQELTEAIQEMEGKMTRTQKRIQNQNEVFDLIKKSKEALQLVTPIPYLISVDYVNESEPTKRMLRELADNVRKFSENLDKLISSKTIIEGEIIND